MFFIASKDAFRLYIQGWRKLLLPGFCIAVALWFCLVAMMELVAHHWGGDIETRSFLILSILAAVFLLEAGLINFLRQVFQNEDGGWRNVLEVFSKKRLIRLLAVLIWLCAFGLILAAVFSQLPYFCVVAKWVMLFLIPLQFYVILTVLEEAEYRSWKCFRHGFRKTISQCWEMWGVWLLAWLSYRIIGKAAWVLTWWIPNRFAGLQVQGYWIMFSFVLLVSCVLPFGVFLLLSLRKMASGKQPGSAVAGVKPERR